MIGQLDLFSSSARTPGREHGALVDAEAEGARTSSARSGTGHTCDECGSQADVMFGCCRACFDAWKAAA